MDSSGNDLSKMISKLMSDEKFSETLAAIKESLASNESDYSATAENDDTPENTPASPQESVPASLPPIPPELISKLPEIMSLLGTSGGGHQSNSDKSSKRTQLLSALKPFLSDRRRSAVDSIINITGIAELFGLK